MLIQGEGPPLGQKKKGLSYSLVCGFRFACCTATTLFLLLSAWSTFRGQDSNSPAEHTEDEVEHEEGPEDDERDEEEPVPLPADGVVRLKGSRRSITCRALYSSARTW